jgi:hypothetical protein
MSLTAWRESLARITFCLPALRGQGSVVPSSSFNAGAHCAPFASYEKALQAYTLPEEARTAVSKD